MEVAVVVMETILLRRAYDCEHDWRKINETEEQCSKCTVIATAFGKENLQRMAKAARRPQIQ